MYRWFRNTHLVAGLLAVPFLLMYGLSAVQMSHGGWFSLEPTVTETTVTVASAPIHDGRALARILMEQNRVRDEIRQVKATGSGIQLQIESTGTAYDVHYSTQTRQAVIRTSVAPFMGMLNRIHHLAGLHSASFVLDVWGGWVVAVSLCLFVLGLTGIYMWFRLYKERVIGAILLAVSLGYSLTLILLIRGA
ncbi:MAG TPA: hypothetical protein VJW77_02430 [Terriglobia bacterium]|nr:hypothetical protein [Terriglobia bacterium]